MQHARDPKVSLNPPTGADSTGADASERVVIRERADPDGWIEEQHRFHDWYQSVAVDRLVPPGAPIDAIAGFLGYLHKLSRIAGSDDFRYDIYGSKAAMAANLDMSRLKTADHPGPVGIEFWENYAALAAEPRHFTGTVEVAGTTVRTKRWIRSVAPVGRSGQVDGFIVLALPQNDNRG